MCPKNSIGSLKNVIFGHFRFISGEISAEKVFFEHFYITKRFVFEFQGSLLSYFWAILLISAVSSRFGGFWQSTASSFRDC